MVGNRRLAETVYENSELASENSVFDERYISGLLEVRGIYMQEKKMCSVMK